MNLCNPRQSGPQANRQVGVLHIMCAHNPKMRSYANYAMDHASFFNVVVLQVRFKYLLRYCWGNLRIYFQAIHWYYSSS